MGRFTDIKMKAECVLKSYIRTNNKFSGFHQHDLSIKELTALQVCFKHVMSKEETKSVAGENRDIVSET